jgi:hypothetical protein
MPKMQLHSFKRTNLESSLFGKTLITAKSLHAHTFLIPMQTTSTIFEVTVGSYTLVKEKLVRYIEHSKLCFFN